MYTVYHFPGVLYANNQSLKIQAPSLKGMSSSSPCTLFVFSNPTTVYYRVGASDHGIVGHNFR